MAELDRLLVRIEADTMQLRRELARAQAITAQTTQRIDRSMADIEKSMSRASGAVTQLRTALGALAGAAVVREFVNVNAEFQRLHAVLVTLTGSSEAAGRTFSQLRQFARETPSELQDVVSAFARLKSMGLDPSVEALRSYGDTASAMGKSLMDMVEAVADATTGEFERLKEFGIRASAEGDRVVFTFRGVSTEVGRSAAEIEDYLLSIGRTDFAGAADRQARTLGGAMTNLQDTINGLLYDMGEGGLTDALVDVANALGALTGGSGSAARELGAVLGDAVRALGQVLVFATEHARELAAILAGLAAMRIAGTFIAAAGAVVKFAQATLIAARAGQALNTVLLGNLPGALARIAIGIAAAAGVWELFGDEATAAIEDAGAALSGLDDVVGGGGLAAGFDDAGKAAKKATEEVDKYVEARKAVLDQADALQLDIDTLGMSAAETARVRTEWELWNAALHEYGQVSPQRAAEIKAIAEEQARLTQRLEEGREAIEAREEAERKAQQAAEEAARKAEQAAEDQRRAIERATDSIIDDAAEMLAGISGEWEDTWDSLADYLLNVMRRTFAQIAAEAIIRPIVEPIVGTVMGGPAGPAAGGAAAGGLQLGSTASILNAVRGGFSQQGFAGLAGTANSVVDRIFGTRINGAPLPGGVGPTPAGATGFLGYGRAGNAGLAAALNLGMALMSGKGMAQAGLSTAGAGIGAFVGGPIGGLVGGFAGDMLGGMFGGSPTTKFRPVTSSRPGGVQTPFGWITGKSKNVESEPIVQALARLDQEIAGTLVPAEIDRVAKALQSTAARQERGKINVATLIGDRYRTVFGALGMDRSIGDQFGQIEDPDQRAAALQGLLEARRAIQDFIDAADPEPMSASAQALKEIKAQFDAVRKSAQALGMPLSKIDAAYRQQVATLRSGFVDAVEQQLLQLTDPMQAEIKALDADMKNLAQEARDLGVFGQVSDDIARIRAARLDDIMGRYAEAVEDTSDALDGARQSIGEYLADLRGSADSPLAPETALGNARARFAGLTQRALGGGADAIASLMPQILDAAKDFDALNREVNASGTAYFNGFNAMVGTLERLQRGLGEQRTGVAETNRLLTVAAGRQGETNQELRALRAENVSLRGEVAGLRRDMDTLMRGQQRRA